MERAQLERLVGLAVEFKRAAEAGVSRKDQEKIMETITPDEMGRIEQHYEDAQAESLKYLFGGTPTDAFILKGLALVEMVADTGLRVIPAAELAKFVPAELKNDADVEAFVQLKAPKLASLCVLKR